jgi:hypothetical protein
MEKLKEYLPKGWEGKAKELGAMTRASGVIREASSLLRLNMLYVSNDGSLQMAATGMAMTEGIAMTKVAAFHRIRKSGEWLRWMAEELCASQGSKVAKPAFLGDRHVILYDASDETTKGKDKTTWRLHYAFDLFDFQCVGMELTTNKEGERLNRHEIKEGSIVIGDRAYGTITGMEHVLGCKGDFVLRYRSKAFMLYGKDGKRLDLLEKLRHLKSLESAGVNCYYKLPTGELRPVRLMALKKDGKAIEESKRKLARKASKKQQKTVHADTAELNEYVILATSLDYTKEQILELYRARWQIEQVFYRLKSLFGYGDVPSKREDAVRAWFYGKLFLAALCESIHKRMPFPPELDSIAVDLIGAQFVDRIVGRP